MKTVRKYIEIEEGVLKRILQGKTIRGGIRKMDEGFCLTFKEYKRLPYARYKDVLIEKTPWGWMKKSLIKTKRFAGFPSDLTLEEKLKILDKENELNKKTLIEEELDKIEFC